LGGVGLVNRKGKDQPSRAKKKRKKTKKHPKRGASPAKVEGKTAPEKKRAGKDACTPPNAPERPKSSYRTEPTNPQRGLLTTQKKQGERGGESLTLIRIFATEPPPSFWGGENTTGRKAEMGGGGGTGVVERGLALQPKKKGKKGLPSQHPLSKRRLIHWEGGA